MTAAGRPGRPGGIRALPAAVPKQHRQRHCARKSLTGQYVRREATDSKLFPRRTRFVDIPRRHDMSMLIEDLARDRMRQMQRDNEKARQIREARAARRAKAK
jgi:hypothetical protein